MKKSYFWLLHLLMIAAGAYFIADMANLAIGSRLEASIEVPKAQNAALPVAAKGAGRDYNIIVEGNIFNSKMRGKKPEAPTGGPTQSVADIPAAPRVPLNQNLIGTVVGSDGQSYAVIEDAKTHEQLLYRIGDLIGEDGAVAKIGRNRVEVRRGTDKEILEVSLNPEDKAALRATPTAVSAAPAGTPGSNIRPSGKNRWVMDRREIDNAVDNLPALLTKARIVPNFADGKPDGFRIFAIADDSLYSKIGLQNGDILHRVNGIEVKDPQNFLKVFEQLKDESAITVDLVRNNQKETFSYDIR
ncbi:MAG: hypothetical protein HY282_15100 [Nitrospirae bacterium]|nr:hypothetical protein [Candidatus Manganitrophaceae bacterium]